MTPLEKEAYAALCAVRDHFGRPVNRRTFESVMGEVRDVILHFDNQAMGCVTGMHTAACTCKPAIRGVSLVRGMKNNSKGG